MTIVRAILIATITCAIAGCSADESGREQAKGDADVFKGYKDAMNKAEDVNQTLMQADKQRRAEMEKNY